MEVFISSELRKTVVSFTVYFCFVAKLKHRFKMCISSKKKGKYIYRDDILQGKIKGLTSPPYRLKHHSCTHSYSTGTQTNKLSC